MPVIGVPEVVLVLPVAIVVWVLWSLRRLAVEQRAVRQALERIEQLLETR